MNGITQLSIGNVRCLADEQTVKLPRVVLLVGENNTGKSTFLACYAAIAQLACNEADSYNPFNSKNFNVGNFKSIAMNGSDSFTLGGIVDEVDFLFKFFAKEETAHLWEKSARIRHEYVDEVTIARDGCNWKIASRLFSFSLDQNTVSHDQISQWLGKAIRYQHLPYRGELETFRKEHLESGKEFPEFVKLSNHLKRLSGVLPKNKPAIYSVSPEFEPRKRNYSVLPSLFSSTEEFERQRENLMRNGQDIELFSDIRLTAHMDGTVSIEVLIDKDWHNLIDVGFGVHSVLPVLQSIWTEPTTTVLMQQPETYLHPKAEVVLAELIAKSSSRFCVETHSNFITRRMRVCARRGIISPEEIVLLWFEKSDKGSRIHSLQIDDEGNILNAPPEFGRFFIEETDTTLGFVE